MIEDYILLIQTSYKSHAAAVHAAESKGFDVSGPKVPTGDYQLREKPGDTLLATLRYLPTPVNPWPYRWVQVF